MASISEQLLGNNCCLVCSAAVSPTRNESLDRFEAVFLLRFLLDIPQDSQLISRVQRSSGLLPTCDLCSATVKQCKQIYTQISNQLQQLWEFQTEILTKVQTDVYHKSNQRNNFVDQCIKHAKNHNYENSFGYPFVFDDLYKLLGLHQKCQPVSEKLLIDTDCDSASGGIAQTEQPFVHACHLESLGTPSSADSLETMSPNSVEISETFRSKRELEFENEDDNDPTVQKSKLPPNDLLSLQQLVSSVGRSTTTSRNYSYVVHNTEAFHYKQYNPNGEIPSSSCGSSLKASYPGTLDEMNITQQEKPDEEDEIILEHSSNEEISMDCDNQPQTSKPVQNSTAQNCTSGQKTMHSTDGWSSRGRNPNKYDFTPNPITGRYHCLDPSCSKSSKSVGYIRKHYEQDHLKIRKKESFSCGWPGCGKIIGDKITFKSHIDRHRGTPQNECKECGEKFYWKRGLIRHKIKAHGVTRRKK